MSRYTMQVNQSKYRTSENVSITFSSRCSSQHYCPRLFLLCSLTIALFLQNATVWAFPFPMQEARSAAMGGVGVAVGVPNAAFINPALLATDDEEYDWLVMLPSVGKTESDPDNLEKIITEYQRDFGTNPSLAEQRLLAADKFTKFEIKSETVSVFVPSITISAMAFLNTRNFGSAKIKVNNTAVANTIVEHRHVKISEQGIALAKRIDEFYFPEDIMIGLNVKLSLIEAYGYDEPISSAQSGLNQSEFSDNTGVINFDLGLAKEIGVWKFGAVVRDLFSYSHTYGDSGEKYKVRPQGRVGFAYRSRRTIWGIDLDVTENTAIVHQEKTQYAAMGVEYQILPGWLLRGGYRQNLVGDGLATASAGMGIYIYNVSFDIAAFQSEDENGLFGQLAMEF